MKRCIKCGREIEKEHQKYLFCSKCYDYINKKMIKNKNTGGKNRMKNETKKEHAEEVLKLLNERGVEDKDKPRVLSCLYGMLKKGKKEENKEVKEEDSQEVAAEENNKEEK